MLISTFQARLVWRNCYALLDEWAPEIRQRLPPGATAAIIAETERCIGRPLPPIVAELYKVHNGFGLPAILEGKSQYTPLLSLEDALAEWRFKVSSVGDAKHRPPNHRSEGVRAAYWVQGWLPIATFGNGDLLFLDLDPAPGGRLGQIVEWLHEEHSFPVRDRDIGTYMEHLDVDVLGDLNEELGLRE